MTQSAPMLWNRDLKFAGMHFLLSLCNSTCLLPKKVGYKVINMSLRLLNTGKKKAWFITESIVIWCISHLVKSQGSIQGIILSFCPFMYLWNRDYLHFFPFFKHFINVFIALITSTAILKKCETKWKSKCESSHIQYPGENWATMHLIFLSEIFVVIQRKNFGYFTDVFRHCGKSSDSERAIRFVVLMHFFLWRHHLWYE